MNEVIFLRPEAGWTLAAALLALALWRLLRRAPYVGVSTGAILTALPYHASRWRRLPLGLAAAAVVMIVFALMDPVTPRAEQQVQSRGIDLALVLDLSSSMEEMMGSSSGVPMRVARLDVTKRAISDFIARRRPGDRLGLVVFSDNAYVVSPLTADHAYLQRYVAMIDANVLRGEGMTAIGEGLATATALLARQSIAARQRAIVLFTDGENTAGRDPIGALQQAHTAGTRVHVVGLDLPGEVRQKPQVRDLIRTVQQRGGRYFTADSAGQLAEASRTIDGLEPGLLVTSRVTRNVPAFAPFAAAAIVLITAALALGALPYFLDRT